MLTVNAEIDVDERTTSELGIEVELSDSISVDKVLELAKVKLSEGGDDVLTDFCIELAPMDNEE